MIPGIMAAQMRVAGGGVVGTVSFVAATGTSYVSSGTTISSPSSPAAIQNNDGLFAVLMSRSAVTPPSGWTLVHSFQTPAGFEQKVDIYRKDTVTTGDSSTAFVWTLAASGRSGLGYINTRSTTGSMTVAQVDGVGTANPSAATHNVPTPVLTAGVDGELFIFAATSTITIASGSSNTWSPPSGATLRTTASQLDNRLAAATQSRDNGQSNSSPWTFTMSGSAASDFAAITLRLAPS
jgi:hypothetical protein